MNFREAMQALLDGKKVRRLDWENPNEWIKWDNNSPPSNEKECHHYFDEDGDYYNDWKVVAPKPISLTPEDVGKRVKLRVGRIVLITEYNPPTELYAERWYCNVHMVWFSAGQHHSMQRNHSFDIIEILP